MNLTVRAAAPADAAIIAELANALDAEHGGVLPFTPEIVLRDAFGERPHFSVLLAEKGTGTAAAGVVGYALFTNTYNSYRAAPGLWLMDLYVTPDGRGLGVGKALMAALGREATARGAESLWLPVALSNTRAIRFYEDLGSFDDAMKVLEFNGPEALARLAAAAA